MSCRVGLVGARGYVGAEILRLIGGHPELELAFVGSRSFAGRTVREVIDGLAMDQTFEAIDPASLASREADAVFLALPNDASPPFMEACATETCVIDLSSDHRFDDGWHYGLPEHHRAGGAGARRVANPGCYATGAQLAIEPFVSRLAAPPRIFGVSGYSGAGTTPSPKNDPQHLQNNLLPYALTGHTHEREIGRHLGHPVCFMPHVAPFFRGITLTIDLALTEPLSADEARRLCAERYAEEPLVKVQGETPLVAHAAGRHHATLGGFSADGSRLVVVATLDNLLKGAATQAIQNLNLALGFDEWTGLPLV